MDAGLIRRVFIIVFCIDVSIGRPVNVGLVQECLEEMNLGDKTIDQLSHVQLGELKGKIDSKYANLQKELMECQDPTFLRGLLDLFIQKHYPGWYGQQTEKKGEQWDRTLLNVMDGVINKIKYLLKNGGYINEEYFKKNVIHRSFWIAGELVHPKTLTPVAEEVLKSCMQKTYNSEVLNRIINLMIEDVKGNYSGVQLLYKEYQLVDKKISIDEVNRLELYKVLKIENVHPDLHDEMKLEKKFEKKHPVFVWYNDKVNFAYILFPSFSEAYSAWEDAKEGIAEYTKDGDASNLAIINQFTDVPDYETHCTIKVPCNVDAQYDEKFSNENCIPKCNRRHKDATFYEYKNIFDALKMLRKNENNVKTFCEGKEKPILLIKNLSA